MDNPGRERCEDRAAPAGQQRRQMIQKQSRAYRVDRKSARHQRRIEFTEPIYRAVTLDGQHSRGIKNQVPLGRSLAQPRGGAGYS